MDYKKAGVDIEAGYRSVELMKEDVRRTMRPEVLGGIGGFSGAFSLEAVKGMEKPVLLSGTDGVGTKLKLAFLLDRHDTIGIDCVAMCVNDVACAGGEPLFFLDYIACGRNFPEKIARIVAGVAEGCVQAGCALIGGETAEHPGMMAEDDYDLAGFTVGVVDKEKVVDKNKTAAGDVVIALPSTGVHSNGFSLVRRVFRVESANLNAPLEALDGRGLGETLLTPTRIYVKSILALLEQVEVHGISHITGGGFYENIPRSIPDGLGAKIEKSTLKIPLIFDLIANTGNIPERDMYNTFNMGVGMSVTVPKEQADKALAVLRENGEEAYIMGEIVSGGEKVVLC